MKLKVLILSVVVFVSAPFAFAQDSELEAMLGGTQGKQGLSTGLGGGISMEQISKALEAIKGGMNLGATDAEYNSAGEIISKDTQCNDIGCQIEGSDSFLGKNRKLDASISMVEEGKDAGLKINLKLINTKTGKVIKTVSETFDPYSKDSLNQVTLRAAKKLLSSSSASKKDPKDSKNKEAISSMTSADTGAELESSVTAAEPEPAVAESKTATPAKK